VVLIHSIPNPVAVALGRVLRYRSKTPALIDPQTNLPPGQVGENYRPNSGNGIQYVSGASDPWGFNTSLPQFNGPFYPVSKKRVADITDGTSNTAAFSEMGLGDMSNAIATEKTDSLALNAWRDGRSVAEVMSGNPPITVADPSWKAGFKLTSYQLSDATKAAGFDLNIPVELSLVDPPMKSLIRRNRLVRLALGACLVIGLAAPFAASAADKE
jgi:hypothetical protein